MISKGLCINTVRAISPPKKTPVHVRSLLPYNAKPVLNVTDILDTGLASLRKRLWTKPCLISAL